MKINLTQISIADRVNAAKIDPSNTDTSSIPAKIDPRPGDSTIAPIDASRLNRAGSDINQQTQSANRATSDSARQGQIQNVSNTQYEKPEVLPDQSPTPNNENDINATSAPPTKGFKESLIDKQVESGMRERSTGNNKVLDRDLGRDNGNPNEGVQKAPNSEPLSRPQMDPYSNSNNRVPGPKPFPINEWDNTNNTEPYRAPRTPSTPTKSGPKFKIPTGRVATPRFRG